MSAPGNLLINVSSSGYTELVAAPPAPSFIEVSHYHLTVNAPTVITFYSNPSGEVLDVCYAGMASGGGISTPFTYDGLLRCNPGQALYIHSTNAVGIGGAAKYSVVGAKPSGG